MRAVPWFFALAAFSAYVFAYTSGLSLWSLPPAFAGPRGGVVFFANYTNSSSGGPISPAACSINFTDQAYSMAFNSSSGLYVHNRSFGALGLYAYNVSCSAAGYDTLNASGNISIKDVSISLQAYPAVVDPGGNLTVSGAALLLPEGSPIAWNPIGIYVDGAWANGTGSLGLPNGTVGAFSDLSMVASYGNLIVGGGEAKFALIPEWDFPNPGLSAWSGDGGTYGTDSSYFNSSPYSAYMYSSQWAEGCFNDEAVYCLSQTVPIPPWAEVWLHSYVSADTKDAADAACSGDAFVMVDSDYLWSRTGGDFMNWTLLSLNVTSYGGSSRALKFCVRADYFGGVKDAKLWVDNVYFSGSNGSGPPSAGNLTSTPVIPSPDFAGWGMFYANHSAANGTAITYRLLGSGNQSACGDISAGDASAGFDISSCALREPSLRVFASFTTPSISYSPVLFGWNISWREATTGAGGNYSFRVPAPLSFGMHELHANLTARQGIYGEAYGNFTVAYVTGLNVSAVPSHVDADLPATVLDARYSYSNGTPVEGAEVLANISHASESLAGQPMAYNSSTGTYRLGFSPAFFGRYNFSIVASKGNHTASSASSYFSVENISVSESLSPLRVTPSGFVNVSGRAVLEPYPSALPNNSIGIWLDGELLGAAPLSQSYPPWTGGSSLNTTANSSMALLPYIARIGFGNGVRDSGVSFWLDGSGLESGNISVSNDFLSLRVSGGRTNLTVPNGSLLFSLPDSGIQVDAVSGGAYSKTVYFFSWDSNSWKVWMEDAANDTHGMPNFSEPRTAQAFKIRQQFLKPGYPGFNLTYLVTAHDPFVRIFADAGAAGTHNISLPFSIGIEKSKAGIYSSAWEPFSPPVVLNSSGFCSGACQGKSTARPALYFYDSSAGEQVPWVSFGWQFGAGKGSRSLGAFDVGGAAGKFDTFNLSYSFNLSVNRNLLFSLGYAPGLGTLSGSPQSWASGWSNEPLEAVFNSTLTYYDIGGSNVLYLPFGEGSGNFTRDLSGLSGLALLGNSTEGTAPAWVGGRYGYGLLFDGADDFVQVNHSQSLNLSAFSYGAWFRTANKSVTQAVVSKAQGGGFGTYLWNDAADGACGSPALCSRLHNGTGYVGVYIPLNSIAVGEWAQVFTVFNGSVLSLYLNGVLVNSTAFFGQAYQVSAPLCVGSEPSAAACTNGSFFNGTIDEVKAYSRPLSAEEVAADFLEGAAWRLNESADRVWHYPSLAFHYNGTYADEFSVGAYRYFGTEDAIGATANILPDPGFEEGSWAGVTAQGADYDAGEKHGGARSVRKAFSSDENLYLPSQTIALKPNTSYVVSVYIRAEGLADPGPGVSLEVSPGCTAGGVKGTVPWALYSCSFTSQSSSAVVRLRRLAGYGNASGTAWWDDAGIAEFVERASGASRHSVVRADYPSTALGFAVPAIRQGTYASDSSLSYPIVSVLPLFGKEEPSGTNVSLDISVDNGTAWLAGVQSGVQYNWSFGVANMRLRYRANFYSNDSKKTARLDNLSLNYTVWKHWTDGSGNYSYSFASPQQIGMHYFQVNLTSPDGVYGVSYAGFRVVYPANLSLSTSALNTSGAGRFFANFTNTSGEPAYNIDPSAECNVSFNSSLLPMAWNSSSLLFEFSRSFYSGGMYLLNVSCTATNFSTLTLNASVSVADTTSPSISILYPAANSNFSSTNVSLNFSVSDNTQLSACWYSLDGWAANISLPGCANSTLSAFAGQNTLRVAANDSSGNANFAEVQFYSDVQRPAVEIQAPAQGRFYPSLNVSLNFSVHDDLGVSQCWYSLDGWATNTSLPGCGNSTFLAQEGSNTLLFYAVDIVGNSNGSAAVSFVVDTTPPAVLISSPQQGIYNTKNISVNFSYSDASSSSACVYELNGENSTPFACGNFTLGLADSGYLLKLWANDSAGNWVYSSVYFVVDTVLPTVYLQYPSPATYNMSVLDLNYSLYDANNISSCWYALNSQNHSLPSCSNSSISPALGPNSLALFANDTAGNVNFSAVDFTYIGISALSVSNSTPDTSAQARFFANYTYLGIPSRISDPSSLCNVSFNSSMRPMAWNSSSLLFELSRSFYSGGQYQFNVSCSAANLYPAALASSVDVWDSTPPAVSIVFPYNGFATDLFNVSLDFSVSDNTQLSGCWYSLNGSNVSLPACANSTVLASAGVNVLGLYANDSYGNVNSSSVSFLVDREPPSVFPHSPAPSFYPSHNISLNFSVSDNYMVSGCWYSINGQPNVSVPGCGYSSFIASEGDNLLLLWANDSFGNLNDSVRIPFVVDTAFPYVLISSPKHMAYPFGNISLNFSAFDNNNVSSCIYELNGVNSTPFPCGNLTLDLSDMGYLLRLWAGDAAGNWNYSQVLFSVDTTPPNITLFYPPQNASLPYTLLSTDVNITTNENSSCRHSSNASFNFLNGSAFSFSDGFNHSFVLGNLTSGSRYSVYYLCNDSLGNMDPLPLSHSFSLAPSPYCGDGSCNGGESCFSCSQDCGACPPGTGGGAVFPQPRKEAEPQPAYNLTRVLPPKPVEVAVSNVSVELYPAEVAVRRIPLSNPSNRTIDILFNISDNVRGFVSFKDAVSSIGAHGSAFFDVQFLIPEDAEAGTYRGELTVYSPDLSTYVRVPVQITVPEVRARLLDLSIRPLSQGISPGEAVRTEVFLYNFGQAKRVDVAFSLRLMDSENRTFYFEDETVAVETSLSMVRSLQTERSLPEGDYVLVGIASYAGFRNRTVEARASAPVRVAYPRAASTLSPRIFLLSSIALLLALTLSFAYSRRRRAAYPKPLTYSGTGSLLGRIAGTNMPFRMDLAKNRRICVVGGSGRLEAAAALAGEFLRGNDAVVVFTDDSGWSGIARPCAESSILRRYKSFGLRRTDARPLPSNIRLVDDADYPLDLGVGAGEALVLIFSADAVGRIPAIASRLPASAVAFFDFAGLPPSIAKSVGRCVFVAERAPESVFDAVLRARTSGIDLEDIALKYGRPSAAALRRIQGGTVLVDCGGEVCFAELKPPLHSLLPLPRGEAEDYERFNRKMDELRSGVRELGSLGVDVSPIESELSHARARALGGLLDFEALERYVEPKVQAHFSRIGKKPPVFWRPKPKAKADIGSPPQPPPKAGNRQEALSAAKPAGVSSLSPRAGNIQEPPPVNIRGRQGQGLSQTWPPSGGSGGGLQREVEELSAAIARSRKEGKNVALLSLSLLSVKRELGRPLGSEDIERIAKELEGLRKRLSSLK